MTGSDSIALSGGEWASLCSLAARGAGYAWGLSEDAGAALAALARWGVDATGAALVLFDREAGGALAGPQVANGLWTAGGLPALCPIRAGAFLSDLGAEAIGAEGLEMRGVAAPVLILPFALNVARAAGRCVRVQWDGGAVVIGADVGAQTLFGLREVAQSDVRFDLLEGTFQSDPAGGAPVPMDARHNAALWGWAMKTMVPETDALRASGAGAGRIDND